MFGMTTIDKEEATLKRITRSLKERKKNACESSD